MANRAVFALAWLLVVAASVAAAAFAQTEAPSSADLPITRVVLFTTGVAYVEHAGTVDGDGELELGVPPEAMDDLLQSLVVEDLGGGRVEPVRYGTRDPLGRILASYPLDLSRDPSLAELLAQARGERVTLQTDAVISGVIVGVEQQRVADEAPRALLTLDGEAGLQRVDLADVRELRFERAELREQLSAALGAIASYRDADEVPVRLRFSGEGNRDVRVGYLREMPVWKTSYRLLLEDDGADLQGWAIFDNPTSLDFEEVQVTFVAGQPASFVSQLFEPVYLERPRVGPPTTRALVPPTDAGVMPAPESRAMMAAPSLMADAVAAEAEAPRGAGVEALADAAAGGATFAYSVREPVTVRRYESVLVPIVRAHLEAHHLSLYDARADSQHPLRGLRIVNDTGLHLAAGPVTVFDERGFTGTARMSDLVPGDDRVLTYARDLDVAIDVTSTSEPEQVISVRLVGGLLESEHRSRLRTTYVIAPRSEIERFVVVEHPRRSGFHVSSPLPAPPVTPTAYRFGVSLTVGEGDTDTDTLQGDPSVPTHVSCETGEPCFLEVVLERVEARRVSVTSVPLERLEVYLRDLELSAETRALLEDVAAVQRELVRLDRAISAERSRRDAIVSDQARLRQNMAALDRNSVLYRRYVEELTEQEDTLAAIARAIEAFERERSALQEELDELIGSL